MSITEIPPPHGSVSTPSAERLKPTTPNPDLWEYNSEELVRFTPMRLSSAASFVWSHFKIHRSKEYANKVWCDYCHKPFAREHSTMSRHIERNHKDKVSEVSPVTNADGSAVAVCSKKEKTISTAKKSQLEQYFTSQVPSLTKAEHDEAMKLLTHAWCENLLPPVLADSLTFSKFVACISRGSFKMPGRTKVTSMIDELYEEMMMKLKDMLKQSSSVSLTTDAAKMPTGDSYVAITGHWISSEWELLSAVLAVSVSNVSHTAEEIATLVQQLGIKYTLDDRLDAISTDNGANFVAAMKELLEDGICEEHVRCACHTLQLTIKNHIDPPKPINGSAATNATSELVGMYRKLVNKIHASPLLTENLRSAQSGGPISNILVEVEPDDESSNDDLAATSSDAPAATRVSSLHATPRSHTLKLIKDVVTR